MDSLSPVIEAIRAQLPEVQAIYLFGSRAAGLETSDSDCDLAVLQATPIEEIARWELASRLSEILRVEVDLVDLRRASAVMRAQVLGTSQLLLDGAPGERMRFEALALADYARLNEERRGILDDVRARGSLRG